MRSKEDIEFHRLGYGYTVVPAVNVKIYESWESALKRWKEDNPDHNLHFTEEWIDNHVSEDRMQAYWEQACEDGWEWLQDIAQEIYGKYVKVYSEGRSGGWAYIDGINTDVDSWDAIEFSLWRRFAKKARAEADNVMWVVIDNIYNNDFEEWVRA